MILTSLALENIGSFLGKHEIELSPTDPLRPIVLIGALNGSGKTTILESLQLVLYGRRAKSLFRIKTGYDQYLKELFSRQASPSDRAKIELAFSNDEAGETVQYRVIRSWSFGKRQPVESVDVIIDGQRDPVMSETWDEEVERLIPRNLSHLFFFDGERIETLADPSQSAEILRTGIYSLLGIELVDQLHSDLSIYRRRKKKSQAKPEERAQISKIESELNDEAQVIGQLIDKAASLQKDLDAANKRRGDAQRDFEKHGGKVYESRSALEKEKIEVSSAIEQIDESLRDSCAHALPLSVVRTELLSLIKQVELEKESMDAGRLLVKLKSRDRQFSQWLAEQNEFSELSLERVEQYLSSDRHQLRHIAEIQPEINMPDEASVQLGALLGSGMSVEIRNVSNLIEKRRQLSSRLDTIDRSMEMMPEESVIRTYLEDKAHADAQYAVLTKERDQLVDQKKQLQFASSQKMLKLERLLAEIKDTELASEESQRLSDYSARVQHVLDQLKRRTLVSHLANLESHISDAFRRLLRKDSLVQSVHIDPESFNVTLTSVNGHEIAPQLISAGERQILAIALLWGLGRAAGRKIPIVIDTPLGRLDSVHRKQLVDEYFPDASHQVILLSTDEEIDEELSSDLADSIAHRYILDFDDEAQFTSVKSGYFWH
jgi:DNA sulfur modification protein DndD